LDTELWLTLIVPAPATNLSLGGSIPVSAAFRLESEGWTTRDQKEVRAMAPLFMIGTIVIEGGLVALIMWLLTAGDREARREEEAHRRLAELEAEEDRLRRAA
jgi:hypothetical protein